MDTKTICDCGICFNSIDSKKIDYSIQLECGHWFHNNCIDPWCCRCCGTWAWTR